jgi:integrase
MKMAVEWEAVARQATRGQMTEARARTVINSIMEHAGQEPVTFYKIEDWMNEWLADKRRSSEKTTLQKYEPIIRRFLEYLGPKAKMGLATLTPANIRSFRNLLHGEGRAASTVNQIISKVVAAPLAKAAKLGYAPLNPCSAVEALREERTTEAGTFTMEQVSALLDAAPSAEWRGFMLAAFYTGQRLRDLADLTWGQVDFSQNMIFLNQSKGDAAVAVPLHPDLLEHLLASPTSDNPMAPVFPAFAGKAGSGRSGLSEAFKRIMVRAGIRIEKRLESAGGVGRGRNNLSFHSFRHSLNSVMANAGVAQEVRQKLLGHRDAETNKVYTHLDFPALQAAIEAVPSINERKPKNQKRNRDEEERAG